MIFGQRKKQTSLFAYIYMFVTQQSGAEEAYLQS